MSKNNNSCRKLNSNIARSTSLDNLNYKKIAVSPPKFRDDTVTADSLNGGTSKIDTKQWDNPLLRDLDNILRNKLKINPESPVISRNNSLKNLRSVSDPKKHAFMKELGLDGDITTVNQVPFGPRDGSDDSSSSDSSDEETGIEDDDEEEFVNVDEIDGPIGNHLPDKRANIDMNKGDNIDYNLSANQDFQKSIDKRVAELDSGLSAEKQPQLKIDWEFKTNYGLEHELGDWFSIADYNHLPSLISSFKKYVNNKDKFIMDDDYAESIIKTLTDDLSVDLQSNLLTLCYISLGNFQQSNSKDDQVSLIRRNNTIMFDYLKEIINAFKDVATLCRDENKNLKKNTTLLFYACNILFTLINVAVETREENYVAVSKLIQIFEDEKLLQYLTQYIEHWRWNSRLSMRIRNIISLLFSLLLLQFGNIDTYKKTKKSLYKYHGIERKEKSYQTLSVSPLHFQAFQDDITARFPTFDMSNSKLPQSIDNTNSLSQFLEIPRSKAKSSLNSTLPAPGKHLATPAPSPPMSPILIPYNDGIKTRKSFQTNMAYPYLYPSDEENDNELSIKISNGMQSKNGRDGDVFIPHSVEEAAEILKKNLDIKLSIMQLWNERDFFMATERGWERDDISKKYDYSRLLNLDSLEEINIMKRIDTYYKDSFASFNSLIFVLCQIMESNLNNVEYREEDLPEGVTMETMMSQLEIVKAKELSLRSSVGIFYILLKWFKLNHILKFEQFSALLYDSGYINTCSAVLGKYSLVYADKAYNKTLKSPNTLWNLCSKFNPIYSKSLLEQEPEKKDINITLLTTVTYILRVLRKVTGDKTHRLKSLPLSVGTLFKQYYSVFNLDVYHPMLRIIRELTPFKNKRWKSEHMDLISGVFLYERLELIDNWVTGKDISGELMDAYGQEVALRALVQFYNFEHYQKSLEELGYMKRTVSHSNLLYKDSEYNDM